jgi:hypothetical protein
MVICNIVTTEMGDLVKERQMEVVNVCETLDGIIQGLPTLIYGVQTVKDLGLYEKFTRGRVGQYEVSHKEDEWGASPWVDKFISESLTAYFDHKEVHLDLLFNKYEYDLPRISESILLHKGKYELYYVVVEDSIPIVYSISKDSLEYIGEDPEAYFQTMINGSINPCVFSTDELDLLVCEEPYPIFFQDYYQYATGVILQIEDIVDMFKPIRQITKSELLYHLVKISVDFD